LHLSSESPITRLSRPARHRCFQRHGISRLPLSEDGQGPPQKRFNDYTIGYLHVDFAEVQTDEGCQHRIIKESTVQRFHYQTTDELNEHLQVFLLAYNHAKRWKTLRGLPTHE
jgi:hypothetical protein